MKIYLVSVLLAIGVMSVTGGSTSSSAASITTTTTTTTGVTATGEKKEAAAPDNNDDGGGKSLSISSSMSVADSLDMSNEDNKQGHHQSAAAAATDSQPSPSSSPYSATSEQFGLRKEHSALQHQHHQQQQQIYSFVSSQSEHHHHRPSFDYSDAQLDASESGKYSSQVEPGEAAGSYYAKVTGEDNSHGGGQGGQQSPQQQQQEETMPLSVDEAFRKYFPGTKPQQPQLMSESQGHPVETDGYHHHHHHNNAHDNEEKLKKDALTIDALRAIVERQPLAKSNPFDPPSPPLSAFLPPPPNSVPQQSADSVHYDPGQHQQQQQLGQGIQSSLIQQQQQQQQQSESSYQEAKYLLQNVNEQAYGGQQQQPQVETRYVYKQVDYPEATTGSMAGNNQQQQQQQAQQPTIDAHHHHGEPADEEEDEGLPYKTEPVSDDGKKVSYVYSKAVQLPDLQQPAKPADVYEQHRGNGQQQNYQLSESDFLNFNQDGEPIHRKPVSYENDADDEPGKAESPFEEIDFNPQNVEKAANFLSQQLQPQPQPVYGGQAADLPVYADEASELGGAGGGKLYGQQDSNFNRPNYDDEKDNAKSQIEYGGFVPIKKHKGLVENDRPQQHQHKHQHQPPATEFIPSPPLPPKFYPEYNAEPKPFPSPLSYALHNEISEGYTELSPPPSPTSQSNNNFKNYEMRSPPPSRQPQAQSPGHKNKLSGYFSSKIQNLRFKPIYGKDAAKKLKDLGINEQEFYGTVNKILQKNPFGKNFYQPKGPRPFMPKANMYRAPNKNRPSFKEPSSPPLYMDEFTLNALKEDLPPGASYNPRDVGLDESVLAHMHMLDSGIGGHRFAGIYPPASYGKFRMRPPYEKKGRGVPPPPPPPASFGKDSSIPYALNSMAMPFIFSNPTSSALPPRPYSATGKGFRSQYGYRAAAASEPKPQFILPNSKALASLLSATNSGEPAAAAAAAVLETKYPLGNIFAIKPIKGIKSLMSYLAGGVAG